MADQRTDAAERSAHVTRGEVAQAEALCCVCGASWRLCSYAARAEGMEAAAKIAEQREDDGETAWAAWPDGIEIASAIRAAKDQPA